MNGLGSIVKATDQEIREYTQQRASNINYYQRRNIAKDDAETLERIGLCARDVFEKLSTLIAKGEKLAENAHKLSTWELRDYAPVVETEGKEYRLFGLLARAKMIDECIFCTRREGGPRFINIENCSTGRQIRIYEPILHDIDKHEYFGRPGTDYRVDPSLLCEVLGLK